MKRVLYKPGEIFKNLLDPLKLIIPRDGGAAAPTGPSAADQRAQELNAQDEARRKAIAEASARRGANASLLSSASLGDTFGDTGTGKKSLLGA